MFHFTFLNHAALMVEGESSILLMDPWLEGFAFDQGWALMDSSTSNEQVVRYLNEKSKAINIWYSHEHSDHFSISFLKALKGRGLKCRIIFQKTLDRRVAKYIAHAGFDVVEAAARDVIELEPGLSLKVMPWSDGDSLAWVKAGNTSLLNLNDCVIKTLEAAKMIREWVGPEGIDILLTQFGYANWVGNESEEDLRVAAAQEKVHRINIQDKVLDPKIIIPFASYVYFCSPESFYMNAQQNTPSKIISDTLLSGIMGKFVVLKPGDGFDLDASRLGDLRRFNSASLAHWEALHAGLRPLTEVAKRTTSLEDLHVSFSAYKKKVLRNFLWAPLLLEFIGLVKPVKINVTDLGKQVSLSYAKGMGHLDVGSEGADLSMSSSALAFLLKNEYGYNTLLINGKFQSSVRTRVPLSFFRFFLFQEFMKLGFGLSNPFHTLVLGFRMVARRISKRRVALLD